MKTLFIPTLSKARVDKTKISNISKKLPKNIAIAYSIQYQSQAIQIKQILLKNHKITKFIQVLGCSKPKFQKNTKAILLITDGRFHAISLSYETKLPIYILENYKLTKISKKDIENFEKRQKASYVKFLNSKRIGILISTKPGQQRLKQAIEFRKKINKKSYLFICNNINTNEFENFGLDSWVNTACPRLDMNNNKIVNIDRLT